MNAAAKALSQGDLFQGNYQGEFLTKPRILLIALIALVFVSSLTVIYTKDLERYYVSETQSLKQEILKENLVYNQLLLEHSTWVAPSRLARVARDKLAMQVPKSKRVIVLERQ